MPGDRVGGGDDFGRLAALALILVDDQDAGGRPTELDGPVGELILEVTRLAVLGDLVRGRLSDVDDGLLVEMGRENFVRQAAGISSIHRQPPFVRCGLGDLAGKHPGQGSEEFFPAIRWEPIPKIGRSRGS